MPVAIAWDVDQSAETMEGSHISIPYHATDIVDFRTILNASLQTRYKYAEYLIWRPYIYSTLQNPGSLTTHGYECCKKAFKVGLPKIGGLVIYEPLFLTSSGLYDVAAGLCTF